MEGAWLELGGAWLGHGWDRRGLAGGKDLGGARVRPGGSELVRGGPELEPSEGPSPTQFSYSWPSGTKTGLGAFPSNHGSRAQGPALTQTPGSGARPGLGLGPLIYVEADQHLLGSGSGELAGWSPASDMGGMDGSVILKRGRGGQA